MGDSAETSSNYVIVQESVNPEVGALSVTNAVFLGQDKTAVELTTSPQNELTYVVTAVNVLDQQGNPIADTKVERGPNRYTADDWLQHPTVLDQWGHGTPRDGRHTKIGVQIDTRTVWLSDGSDGCPGTLPLRVRQTW